MTGFSREYPSRRDFLAAGGTTAAVWLGTDPAAFIRAVVAARTAAARGGAPQLDVLTPEQAADIEAIAEQIIPADDLPGAREGKVIVYVDRALGSFAQNQRDPLLRGLDELNERVAERWPGTARFAQLPKEHQTAVLRDIEETPFFQQVRGATIVGMFANPAWGGNHDGAGWRVLGFEPRHVWRPPFGYYDAQVSGERP